MSPLHRRGSGVEYTCAWVVVCVRSAMFETAMAQVLDDRDRRCKDNGRTQRCALWLVRIRSSLREAPTRDTLAVQIHQDGLWGSRGSRAHRTLQTAGSVRSVDLAAVAALAHDPAAVVAVLAAVGAMGRRSVSTLYQQLTVQTPSETGIRRNCVGSLSRED